MADILLPRGQFIEKYYEGGDPNNPIVGMIVEYGEKKNKQSTYEGNAARFTYKIRLCTGNSSQTPDDQVISVPHPVTSSGRGGFYSGDTLLSRGDFVRLLKHKKTGEWYIDSVLPVCTGATLDQNAIEGICQNRGGWTFRDGLFQVPLANQGPNGGAPINETFFLGVPDRAKWDTLYLSIPPIQLKTPCEPSSMAGMPTAMSNLLRDVQDLRTGLLGDDSFLVTSQQFVDEVQAKVDSTASIVAGAISWLIQEIKKQIMRQINTIVNNTVGAAYLNTRYQIFEGVDAGLAACNCVIAALLDTLAQFIADALNNFINDIITPATCAIENFLSDLLSQIANGILSAISGILGGISNIIGAVIDVVDTILGVVESLLNIFEGCPPRQVCPADEEWNFLEGVAGGGNVIDIQGIFDRVNDSISSFRNLGNAITEFPSTFDNFNFNLDPNSALASAGGCFVGPSPCGPPTVRFFGGGAVRDAVGRAVVSRAGQVLGIQILDPGSGYRTNPMVVIDDPCGLGIGARASVEIGPIPDTGGPSGGGPPSGDGNVACNYSREQGYATPGIYLDLTSVSSRVNVPFFVSKEAANNYTVNIPGVRTFNENDVNSSDQGGISVSVEGGRIYGPCTLNAGNGTLYVGNQTVSGVSGSGGLPNTCLVVEEGGDDWNDFVIRTGRGRFINLTDCTQGSTTTSGVTTATILQTGHSYLPSPDGSRGANGRQYGERCQTLVQRALGTWDQPFNPGDVITLETGDRISLPAQGEIQIGDAVLPVELTRLGARIVTINPPLATIPYRSMVGFDDSVGEPGWFSMEDYNEARRQGYTDPDIRFYLERNYVGRISPRVQTFLNDPNWGRQASNAPVGYYGIRQMFGFDDSAGTTNFFGYIRDYQEARRRGFTDADIRYYLENHYTGQIGPRMQEALDDPNFGRIQGISNMAGVPFGTPRDMQGFSDAYGDPGAFGNLDYEEARRQGYTDADIRYYLENHYTGIIGARMRTRLNDPSWGRVQVDRGFSDVPGDVGAFGSLDLEQATRQNQTDATFLNSDSLYEQAIQEGYTDADVRYYLENYYRGEIGPEMQSRLDDPTWGRDLPVVPGPSVSAPPRIRSMIGFNDGPGRRDEFSNADLDEARRRGFRDVDIRFYLENNYTGYIADGIRRLLSDPNWGRLGQTITVSLTAPGCPDDQTVSDLISSEGNLTSFLANAVIADPGFGYNCGVDQIVVTPSNGAQLEYDCVNGSISNVRVVDPGSGFTELPEITINSDTGYNARIVPVLGFTGISTAAIGAGTTFIRVVDCVGTIPPRRPLDVVPE